MHAVPDVPSDPSRLSNLRRLFGRRDDPYSGADADRARRLGGIVWMASSAFAVILVSLSPPTGSPLGPYGWGIAGMLFAGALYAGYSLLRRGTTTSNDELYALSFAAIGLNALMEYLAGGRDTPWHNFYLIAVLFTAAIHPPRRVAMFFLAYVAAASSSAFHSGGWSHAEAGEVGLETIVTLAIGVLALAVMDGVRAQRTMLVQEGDEARHLAHVDELTGLGNRRALMSELETAVPTDKHPLALALYDLDGFKGYNDSFGHVAGDALLQRLAERLRAAAGGDGHAFRMGGDEFCLVTRLPRFEAEALVLRAHRALTDAGEGFSIDASYGWTLVTDESTTPSDILRAADRGMYARKTLSRVSAGTQTTDVLLSALGERSEELGAHVHDVRDLCDLVADELGLWPEEKAPLLQAASLHDVGKVAVPDSILEKPGPLSDEEWEFMRKHTIIGERILTAAPALADAARLVRSSHERWDGWGYPDALTGEEIPLGARIIAVCDAFDAMVSPRPYRKMVSEAEALAELDRCSGTQFDPRVVEAFAAVRAARQAGDDLALRD
ncbi:MAG TPA: diguanylate cyclase [Thermoleophilaceae bacterium]|jgi:diguanylate cyclase (GGDEF)-like protein